MEFIVISLTIFYFLPTVLALIRYRKIENTAILLIFFLNFFLAWTGIIWFILLGLALMIEPFDFDKPLDFDDYDMCEFKERNEQKKKEKI